MMAVKLLLITQHTIMTKKEKLMEQQQRRP